MINEYANPKEKRSILRNYIRSNPSCSYRDIRKDTKVKVERIYSSMKEAYRDAGIKEPRTLIRYSRNKRRKMIIDYIRENPKTSINDIRSNLNLNPLIVFSSIRGAFEAADVEYPKREITSGVMDFRVLKRCKDYESKVIKMLEKFGRVIPKVRLMNGKIIDCILEKNNKKYVVEIKNYKGRNNITMSDIKQLVNYMRFLNLKKGLIICPKESFPKIKNSRNIYIDNLSIRILSEEDLLRGDIV
tara:strand:- start:668 stop:1399 length:732 start_codon:yes stop_codon:yes gene_type:complete